MTKLDPLTIAERAEVEARVAAGAVTVLPAGVSSFDYPVWDAAENKLVGNSGGNPWRRNGSVLFERKNRKPRVYVVSDEIVARRARVAELHATGMIILHIAQAIGETSGSVHPSTIRADMDVLGLVPHVYERPNKVDHAARLERFATLAQQGGTVDSIAAALGICAHNVKKLARAADIKLPRRRAAGAGFRAVGKIAAGMVQVAKEGL
jgi:predicted transcriptional regulator